MHFLAQAFGIFDSTIATEQHIGADLLIHLHSRRLQLELRQTCLPQPGLDILLVEANLLCANPCRRVHVHAAVC